MREVGLGNELSCSETLLIHELVTESFADSFSCTAE